MRRRGFLQALLGGAAILTGAQRKAVEAQVEQLPAAVALEPGDAAARSEVDTVAVGLNWRQPVFGRGDLPTDAADADAVFLEGLEIAVVFVTGAGWIDLAGVTA